MIVLVPPSLNWGHGSLPTPQTLLCFFSAHLKDPPTTHRSKTTRKPLANLASLKLAASLTPEKWAKTTQKKEPHLPTFNFQGIMLVISAGKPILFLLFLANLEFFRRNLQDASKPGTWNLQLLRKPHTLGPQNHEK